MIKICYCSTAEVMVSEPMVGLAGSGIQSCSGELVPLWPCVASAPQAGPGPAALSPSPPRPLPIPMFLILPSLFSHTAQSCPIPLPVPSSPHITPPSQFFLPPPLPRGMPSPISAPSTLVSVPCHCPILLLLSVCPESSSSLPTGMQWG